MQCACIRQRSERKLTMAACCIQRRFRRQQMARLRQFEARALLEKKRIERREALTRATAAAALCSTLAAADAAISAQKASNHVKVPMMALQAAHTAALAAATAADRACAKCYCAVSAAVQRQLAQQAAADAAVSAAATAVKAAHACVTSAHAAEIAANRALSERAYAQAALQLQVLARRWLQQRAGKAIVRAAAVAMAAAAASAIAADFAENALIPPLPPLQLMPWLRRAGPALPTKSITKSLCRWPRRLPTVSPHAASVIARTLPALSQPDHSKIDRSDNGASIAGAVVHDMLVAQGTSWDKLLRYGLRQPYSMHYHRLLCRQPQSHWQRQLEPQSQSADIGQRVQLLGQQLIRVGVGQWTNKPQLGVGDSLFQSASASLQFPRLH